MRKITKTAPGTARKSESILEPESELPVNLSHFWNQTRIRQIIWVSSRTGTGTGRNMDPLQQCWTALARHFSSLFSLKNCVARQFWHLGPIFRHPFNLEKYLISGNLFFLCCTEQFQNQVQQIIYNPELYHSIRQTTWNNNVISQAVWI